MSEPRQDCLRCSRPQVHCICDQIVVVPNRTRVTIVQHPGERHHRFNTARLARLALGCVDLEVAWPDGEVYRVSPELLDGAALLFPSEDAVDLADLPVDRRPTQLVVLDGTWSQARRLYRDNAWMQQLPHVALDPARPSQYQIRREPKAQYVSTIESIRLALELIEPDTPHLDQLLDGFLGMVDKQVKHAAEPARRRKIRQRPNLLQRLEREWDELIVAYPESVGLRRKGVYPELLQWTAVRVATGETFDARVQTQEVPRPELLEEMGLGDVEAQSLDSFRASWRAFAGDDPIVCTWSTEGTKLLRRSTGRIHRTLPLRSAYGNLRGGLRGRLDALLAAEGVDSAPQPVRGRARNRLGHAVAMATWLRDQAPPHHQKWV